MIYLDTIMCEVVVLRPIRVKDILHLLRESGIENWQEYTIVVRY